MNMMTPFAWDSGGTFGQRIKSARLAREWSLDELAGRLGVSKVSVWAWEHDRSRPKLATLKRLSAVLGIPRETLLSEEGADSSGQAVSDLVADCKARLGRAVGVSPDAVEIRITFAGPES